ncbi:MAG: 7-cyano-7-deazaguanine synthase QueC [Rhodospirillales bacterium]|nr:7-cyano-7-deazaguanine synthase QueC [Rhodospirillales bacterium]MCW8861433.1 7-cyano-7-deazaguanine synthase QueC [Rhodospirillales bacterium]MCW8951719.1 7-cyano-7-deazaguanine synthase QueC [Rhodospirillales bacterium]MCW8971408.1 7-cyano-7-deazaguanine synthase QueC [Rhodospirillales bacterium]MCW9002637.1 7-cyano-7-deazaguanine synthase QueC [Rhodospirillales bacterium]
MENKLNAQPKPRAVVLLSGGLDSTTVLAIAMAQGFDVHTLSFRYGQRHAHELDAARAIAEGAGVRHAVLDLDLSAFGGSALTADIPVPKDRDAAEMGAGIPVTYVPARNTIFLSCALGMAETLGTGDIFIGVNALDYSGYPDCRPEYIAAFERMANLATKGGVEGTIPVTIHTPLIDMTKAQIIRRGLELGVDYSLTTSCYDPAPDGTACGHCDACGLRLRGFRDAGIDDPIPYRA